MTTRSKKVLQEALALTEKERTEVVEHLLNSIEHPPSLTDDDTHRRFLLHRFPYSIIYRSAKDDKIWIVAVAHQKRYEGYWRDRM